MKQRMIKIGCIGLLTVSMLSSQAGMAAAMKTADISGTNIQAVERTESYIAVVEDSESYRKLEEMADKKCILADSQPQQLEDNQMMLLNITSDEAVQLEKADGIVTVEENVLISANEEVPVDYALAERLAEQSALIDFNQWNLDAVNWQETSGYTGRGVDVAVLDSGISFIKGLDVTERKDFVNPEIEEVNPLFDDATGHGTSIAGIIAGDGTEGELQGIAEDVNLHSVRILDAANEAPVSRVIEGIYWCINNDIDVINMSFGTTTYSAALEKAVRDAEAAGIIMVAAAGNRGNSAGIIDYPAAFDGVIAVGASTGKNQMADFTSDGKGIDILAPGEKVWSYSSMQGLMAVDGTSIATAHVSGAVASLLEKKPDMGMEFVRQLLTASSVQSADRKDLGILNMGNALVMQDSFQVQEKEMLPGTDVEQKEYDTSGIVSGCWGAQKHADTIVGGFAGNCMYFMSAMAQYADTYYSTRSRFGQFHGQHNYVANLHFLYEAAFKIRDTDYDLSTASGAANYLSQISVAHREDNKWGATDFAKMREAIADAFTNPKTDFQGRTMAQKIGALNNWDKSYMIMGLAAHLLGDTFAHRTMVPKDAKFDKAYFGGNWGDFQNRLADYVIEFRDIKKYSTDSNASRKAYEDNISFYPNRYNATEKSVRNLLALYKNNNAFNLGSIIKDFGFVRKLNNFQAYANSAGFSTNVFAYSTDVFRVDWFGGEDEDNESDYENYSPNIYVYTGK